MAIATGGNLFRGLPERSLDAELVEVLGRLDGGWVERIVSTGQASPADGWYDQDTDEVVVVVAGAARLRVEDEDADRTLSVGDWLVLPAGCRHRVTWTQADPPTVWFAVHLSTGTRS